MQYLKIMKQEKITEGNRLIAEFLGYYIKEESIQIRGGIMFHKVLYDNAGFRTDFYSNKIRVYEATEDELYSELRFHKSWDLLMPVVKKINKWNPSIRPFTRIPEGVNITITPTKVKLYASIWSTEDKNFGNWIILKKKFKSAEIESVYLAVVEFIKWYNKQKI
jgi:hypothetical protein